jgi:DNA-binding transcriptional MerR regulator/effector-binding domain-containing protein
MQATLTIGDFSRITHLSIKTLRHYHRVELLEPGEVNADTGYRYYSLGQVPVALAIRRYRDLGMPIEDVRAVLAAPDASARDALIAAHLNRLQDQLAQTQAAVASLQALLARPEPGESIEHRSVQGTTVLAITDVIERADLGDWWAAGLAALREAATGAGLAVTGPAGGLFDDSLFTDERGECSVFLPVADAPPAAGGARRRELPATDYAIAVHRGSHEDADRTYAALGSYVAEHGLGGDGPVREHYLVGRGDTEDVATWRTEICWPLSRSGG